MPNPHARCCVMARNVLKERFFEVTLPGDAFAEMQQNAMEVFERNLNPFNGGLDRALGATYLDGFLAGAMFVLKRIEAGTWPKD